MAQNIGNLGLNVSYNLNQQSYNRILQSINNLSRQATTTTRAFTSMGNSLKAVGKVAVTALSIKAVVGFSKSCIELASDLAEVQNVVDTTFGEMSNYINSFSKSAMRDFGLSETSAKRYASTIGAISKSMGFTTQDALILGKSMTALAADMASFYNLSTDDAFAKIRAGLTGETEPLKALGINMSVANLEAYALSQGITKAVSAMTEQEKMLLRNNYLLSVTADAQGDFARTSSGWANQTRFLQQQWESFKTTLGNIGIKFVLPIIQRFNELLTVLNSTTDRFASFIGLATNSEVSKNGVSDLASSASGASDAVQSIAESYNEVGKAATKAKGSTATFDKTIQINKKTKQSNNSAKNNSVEGSSFGVGLSEYSFTAKASMDTSSISDKIKELVDKVKEYTAPLTAFYDTAISPIISWVGVKLKDAISFTKVEFDKWGQWFTNNLPQLTEFSGLIGNVVNSVWTLVEPLADSVWESFKGTASTLGELTRSLFNFILDNKDAVIVALSTVAGIWAGFKIMGIAQATTLFLANALAIGANTTAAIANTVANGGLLASFGALLGAKMADIAANIQLGILYAKDIIDHGVLIALYTKDAVVRGALAVKTGALTVAQGAWTVATTLATAAGTAFGAVLTFLTSPIGLVIAAITAAIAVGVLLYKNWDTIKGFGNKFIGWIKSVFATDFSEQFGIIGSVIDGWLNGVKTVFNGVKQVFGGVIDFITGVFSGNWKKAFSGLKDIVVGVFKSIAVISMGPFLTIMTLWNAIVDKIGQIKIPDWVPFGLGGKQFSLPKIPKPNLQLAQGGVVTGRTWAEIGEIGPEVVMPLKNNSFTQSFAQDIVSAMSDRSGSSEREVVIKFENNNIFGSDLDEIARLVKRALEKENIRVGGVSYEF